MVFANGREIYTLRMGHRKDADFNCLVDVNEVQIVTFTKQLYTQIVEQSVEEQHEACEDDECDLVFFEEPEEEVVWF